MYTYDNYLVDLSWRIQFLPTTTISEKKKIKSKNLLEILLDKEKNY